MADERIIQHMRDAVEHGLEPDQLAQISIAISMKRIADTLAKGQTVTLLSQISKSLGEISEALKPGMTGPPV